METLSPMKTTLDPLTQPVAVIESEAVPSAPAPLPIEPEDSVVPRRPSSAVAAPSSLLAGLAAPGRVATQRVQSSVAAPTLASAQGALEQLAQTLTPALGDTSGAERQVALLEGGLRSQVINGALSVESARPLLEQCYRIRQRLDLLRLLHLAEDFGGSDATRAKAFANAAAEGARRLQRLGLLTPAEAAPIIETAGRLWNQANDGRARAAAPAPTPAEVEAPVVQDLAPTPPRAPTRVAPTPARTPAPVVSAPVAATPARTPVPAAPATAPAPVVTQPTPPPVAADAARAPITPRAGTTPSLPANPGFTAQEIDQSAYIIAATPYNSGNSFGLLVYQPKTPNPSAAPGTVLSSFDDMPMQGRFTDSNGYSIRVGEQDLGWSYDLRIRRVGQELVLYGQPSQGGNQPELVIGRAPVSTSGFPLFALEPGWRLTRRVFEGRTQGHMYFTNDAPLSTLGR
jgi:hypothetical protein